MAASRTSLPSAIAYPAIAGLPPETGLYASIAPLVAYAVFGPSRQLIVGPDAATITVMAAVLATIPGLAAAENDANFMVLPINLDLGSGGLDKAKAFLTDGKWANLPLYADSTFDSFKKLQTSAVALGLPSTLLIDKNGCELAVLQGPAEWDSEDGRNVIAALKSI